MTRVDVLRSQASVLWRLAESFDIPLIRYDLLREEAQPQESQNALP